MALLLFALALRHRGRKASNYTFGEGSELEHDELAWMHNCINTEVRFRALISDGVEHLELVNA